jgi:hypothetical protein
MAKLFVLIESTAHILSPAFFRAKSLPREAGFGFCM